jgi:1-pyrroline-5-carboxylate dehydrogenase
MFNGIFQIPQPRNEPCLQYAPGSGERSELKSKLKELLGRQTEVPMIINGQDVHSGNLAEMRCPHNHQHILGKYHQGDAKFVTQAIDVAQKNKRMWGEMPWDARAIVFLKAAELLAGKYRQTLNAATMLNMSKTPYQAEIDAACELIDFWRFNPHFMQEVYGDQPMSTQGVLNYMQSSRP